MYTKVTYNFEADGRAISTLEICPPGSNMSNLDLMQNNALRKDLGFNGFILGTRDKQATPLSGEHRMFSQRASYPGYIGQTVYATREVDETFTLYVYGDTPKYLMICFDGIAREYATAYTIQNSENINTIVISGSNEIMSVIDLTSLELPQGTWTGSITVHITQWSHANRNVKVTKLRAGEIDSLQFYESELVEYECSEHMLDSNMSIAPGICEQYADITVYDRFKLFEKANKDIECRVTIETVNPDRVLGTYYVRDWDIPGDSSEITSHCGDFSTAFDNLTFMATAVSDRSVHQMLQLIFDQNGFKWLYKDNYDNMYCERIIVPNSWLKTSTLREALDKVCWLGMLRIYWNKTHFIVTRAVDIVLAHG